MERHPEGEHEVDGLRVWDGNGAIRLLDADERDDVIVLLLERCIPGTALRSLPEPAQDVVLCDLLRRLWSVALSAGHRFTPLTAMCEHWVAAHEEKANRPLDPGLDRAGMELFVSLARSSAPVDDVLLCTDLHAGNVLAAERAPWLMIDPKPHVGDRHYDALQHMLNCEARLVDDPDGLVARLASMLDLDRNRLRQWTFARCVIASMDRPACATAARALAP